MKPCSTCRQVKPLEDYQRRTATRDGRAARCRECCRAWYMANRDVQKARVLARNNRYRKELYLNVANYFTGHPCVDCGEEDVRCLEFDHRPEETKLADVSRMISDALPWKRILGEIAKCDVRCANCHRRRTAERGGFWRDKVHQALATELHERAVARLNRLCPDLP